MPAATPPPVDALTEINIADLLDAIGLSLLRCTPLRRLLHPPARRFARIVHEFDTRVRDHGLAHGSAWLINRMSAGLLTSGLAHVPSKGPVFVLANHPGMTDAIALFASLAARPDLRVIALDRPFLRALPHVARQLIFLPEDAPGRLAAVRAAARHLKEGGALLSFPAGAIEPDPATFGACRATASLGRWSDSYTLFARLAPGTQFVPALVSHVISPAAQRHPLTLTRRTPHEREKLAAALQVTMPRYRDLVGRVRFGQAVCSHPGDTPGSAQALATNVKARMQQLISETCRGERNG